ncbi:adenine phosphoribosyltransferase [soil metagenome]
MTSPAALDALLDEHIREIADFPKPGVGFKDITPLLADAQAFAATIDGLAELGRATCPGGIDHFVGMEARGFILAAPVALALGAGFVPVRKHGKLPAPTYDVSYALEYGEATLEVHRDAFGPGDKVLLVDDVLATGGTVQATAELVARCGATAVGVVVLLELSFLSCRRKLGDLPFGSLRRL